MSILETIYESYIEGELNIKPDCTNPGIRQKIEEFEKQYNMTPEQAEEFERLLFDIFDRYEKKMFFAGFKVASQLADELSEKPKNADEQ